MLKDQGRGITPAIRRAVLGEHPYDAPDCVYCGMVATEVDHIVPRSRGGGLDPENLAPACFECNHEKLDRTPEEWARDRAAAGKPWPIPSLLSRIRYLTARGVVPMRQELHGAWSWVDNYEQYRERLMSLRSVDVEKDLADGAA